MRRPLVSVIIPNYNGERFLRESINSVLRQTYTPIEVIVVDDGSTDNSKEIITSYKKRIKSYFLPHRNANVARNFGFRKSSGEYVQFLDSDVVIFPEKIKVQVERFRSLPADYGVIYGGYSVVERESNRRVDVLKGYRGNIYKILLEKDVVGNPSHLISRTTFERVGGYDEEMESMQDWDLWLRISNVSKFEFIPFLSAVYFIEGSQTSSNLLKVINGRKKLLHKYYKELAKFPYILSFHLYRLGVLSILNNDYKSALMFFLKSIAKKPIQRISYLSLLFSLLSRSTLKKRILDRETFRLGKKVIYY